MIKEYLANTVDPSRQGPESREAINIRCARFKWAGRVQQGRLRAQVSAF